MHVGQRRSARINRTLSIRAGTRGHSADRGGRRYCRGARPGAARQSPGSAADRAAAPGGPGAALAGRVVLERAVPAPALSGRLPG
jgi:hypothetical protein